METNKSLKLSILFSFLSPVALYAHQLYPEIVAALIIIYAFRKTYEGPGNSPPDYLKIMLPMIILPWLNIRYAPAFTGLLIYLFFMMKRKILIYLSVFVPMVISFTGLCLYSLNFYGSISPVASRGFGSSALDCIHVDFLLNSAMKLILDREIGILIYTPLFILCLLGFLIMIKDMAIPAMFIVLIIFLEYSSITINAIGATGEWAPPARYLVCIVPLLYIFLAYAYEKLKSNQFKSCWNILLTYSIVISFIMLSNPILQYNSENGSNIIVTKLLGMKVAGIVNCVLPSFFHTSFHSWVSSIIILLSILILNGYLYIKEKNL